MRANGTHAGRKRSPKRPKSTQRKPRGWPRTHINLSELERLAAIGYTHGEIAAHFNVTPRTIERRLTDEAPLRDAIEIGREKGRAALRRAMMTCALQCGRPNAPKGSSTMAIFLSKQAESRGGLGFSDKLEHDVTVEHSWADLVASAADDPQAAEEGEGDGVELTH